MLAGDGRQLEQRDDVAAYPLTNVSLITLPLAIAELPENTPRYVLLSYRLAHNDGRVSFPLVLVYWAPQTSSTEMSTLYTSALSALSVKADVGKVVDMRDGTLDRKALEGRLGA